MSTSLLTFRIGEFSCTPISDGGSPFPAAWLLSNLSDEERAQALSANNMPSDQIVCDYTCLLIRTPTNTLLLDTGAGNLVTSGGKLLQNLERESTRAGDIDTVILTHAHPDHIGGIVTVEGKPAFPNARFVMWKSEWDFWTADNIDLSGSQLPDELKTSHLIAAVRRFLPPIQNQVELIERATEIVSGIHLVSAPGHTPGHTAVLITSGGDSLLHLADAVIHPIHLKNPAWQTAFDLQHNDASRTRRRLLDRASADQMRVMAYHFPFPGVGHVVTRGLGWEWEPDLHGETNFSSVA